MEKTKYLNFIKEKNRVLYNLNNCTFEFRKGKENETLVSRLKHLQELKRHRNAVKEGGPNPDANSRLRAVIQNSKAANMPKENVERD
jgi:transcriptional/translational regulatory protein YebC/TACO1